MPASRLGCQAHGLSAYFVTSCRHLHRRLVPRGIPASMPSRLAFDTADSSQWHDANRSQHPPIHPPLARRQRPTGRRVNLLQRVINAATLIVFGATAGCCYRMPYIGIKWNRVLLHNSTASDREGTNPETGLPLANSDATTSFLHASTSLSPCPVSKLFRIGVGCSSVVCC